jgi:hypothetical protein
MRYVCNRTYKKCATYCEGKDAAETKLRDLDGDEVSEHPFATDRNKAILLNGYKGGFLLPSQ